MTNDVFKPLLDELSAWNWTGTPAELWWRDDDAAEPEVALDRLINLTEDHKAPCGLAVIPAKSGDSLARFLAGTSYIWVLQHGYAHVNHAPGGEGAWELGDHRPVEVVLAELADGKETLSSLFHDRFVPVVVPPWNKMAPVLLSRLPSLGFRGASASYKRKRPVPPKEFRVADAHCDLLTWKEKGQPAQFSGAEKCVDLLVKHLTAKRKGRAVPTEPTCVLTHHLEMDEAAWAFLEELIVLVNDHSDASWVSPADIWPAE